MSVIKIKKESLAKRCEICHQSDFFEPYKNYCTRCEKLIITKSDKGTFRVNLRVDLSLLANTLRNFAWQNIDSPMIKALRRVLVIAFITPLLLFWLNQQFATNNDYYGFPEPSQTEEFAMLGCGYYYSDFDMFIFWIGFFSFIGAVYGLIKGLNAYFGSSLFNNSQEKFLSL